MSAIIAKWSHINWPSRLQRVPSDDIFCQIRCAAQRNHTHISLAPKIQVIFNSQRIEGQTQSQVNRRKEAREERTSSARLAWAVSYFAIIGIVAQRSIRRNNSFRVIEQSNLYSTPTAWLIFTLIVNFVSSVFEQELVSTKNSGRLKKILCIGLIMLVFAALIGTAYYFYGMEAAGSTSESNRSPQISGKPSISLSDYLENKLYAKRNNATWLSDSELAYTDATVSVTTPSIVRSLHSFTHICAGYSVDIQHPYEQIVSAAGLRSSSRHYSRNARIVARQTVFALGTWLSKGKWSRKNRSIIYCVCLRCVLFSHMQQIFRHSTVARYEILDLQTNEVTNVSESHLLLAEWGPIGNALVFVQDNNIYYKANVDAAPAQVTTDGRENIYNGVCDWVYEEEVFSTKTALWFSPDGAQLAYIRFDDTPVRTMQIPIYGLPGAFQYPEEIIIPYPKTGSPNPKVQLFSVDLKTLATENKVEMYEILAPSKLRNVDHIVAVVAWANNDTLLSTWMNRVQNESYVQVCVDDKCKLLKSWVSHTGWVDFFKAPLFNADGTKFVFINSTQQSDKRSYRHLTMVSMADGTETPLTTGTFVVLENLHWDLKRNRIFYLGTQENASYTQQVYAVDVDKGKSTCLSCNVVRDGVPQTHFLASISPNGESMVLTSDGPSLPRADIVAIKSADPIKLEHLFTWEENKNLAAFLETKSAPIVQHHKIPLSNGFDAIVKLQIPPNIDLNGTQKYPMVVYVYAGPGSYAGTDRFDYSFGTYLCTNHSYIIAEINGRGSGQQSDELLHQIYRSLGTVEIEDQIETAA